MSRSPAPGTGTVENAEVTLLCQVHYHGYKAPVLEWFNNAGVMIPSTEIVDPEDTSKVL